MDSLGEKVAGAQSHVSRWVGSVRRSLHEALNLVTAAVAPERAAGEGPGRAPFKRTASFRQLASRGRESFRQFSVRSQRRLSSLRKRPAGGPEQPSPTPELDHLKQCFGRPSAEARDTDVLVQEADGRYGTWGDQHQSGDSFTPESPSSEGSMAPAQKPSPGRPASWYSSQRGPATATDRPDLPREQRSHSLDGSSPDASPAKPPATEKGSPDFSFLEVGCRAGAPGSFGWGGGLCLGCKPVSFSLAVNCPAGLEGPEEPRPAGQKAAAASGPRLPHPQEECQRRCPAGPLLCSGGSSQRLDVQGLHRREAPQGRRGRGGGGGGAPTSREAVPCPAAAASLSRPGPLRPQGSTQEKAGVGREEGGRPPCAPLQVAQRSVSGQGLRGPGAGGHPREGREVREKMGWGDVGATWP
uniref:Uncharacterized protein n=1 Tax=Pseudonaja textilis TaxID=8673 RepID=A0A670ZYL0_PSETE